MNRITFLKSLLGVSLVPTATLAAKSTEKAPVASLAADAQRVRRELLAAWAASEKMSLVTVNQMPADGFSFCYAPGAMSYAQQWRHCCQFTTSQLTARLGLPDPYADRGPSTTETKRDVVAEVKNLYAFVRRTIETTPDAALFVDTDYLGDELPIWRLFYALENHIIHHRGQCMVYLRLKGVTPEGYLGW